MKIFRFVAAFIVPSCYVIFLPFVGCLSNDEFSKSRNHKSIQENLYKVTELWFCQVYQLNFSSNVQSFFFFFPGGGGGGGNIRVYAFKHYFFFFFFLQMGPQTASHIAVHGLLLWASMGFLTPVGILTIRMSNKVDSVIKARVFVYLHIILQVDHLLCSSAKVVWSVLIIPRRRE